MEKFETYNHGWIKTQPNGKKYNIKLKEKPTTLIYTIRF
jgi:hypothetical protein